MHVALSIVGPQIQPSSLWKDHTQ